MTPTSRIPCYLCSRRHYIHTTIPLLGLRLVPFMLENFSFLPPINTCITMVCSGLHYLSRGEDCRQTFHRRFLPQHSTFLCISTSVTENINLRLSLWKTRSLTTRAFLSIGSLFLNYPIATYLRANFYLLVYHCKSLPTSVEIKRVTAVCLL